MTRLRVGRTRQSRCRAVMPRAAMVSTSSAPSRIAGARFSGLELNQKVGPKTRNSTSHATHRPPVRDSPLRVELSRIGRPRNTQVSIPAARKTR